MKNFLLILLLLCWFGTQAQEKDDFKRFGVGVNYTYLNCFRYESNSFFKMGFRLPNDSSLYNFSSGFRIYFNLNKHFSFQTGVQYSTYNHQTKWEFQNLDSWKRGLSVSIVDESFEFPLRCDFNFGSKKISFTTGIEFVPFAMENFNYSAYWLDTNYKINIESYYNDKYYPRLWIMNPSIITGINYFLNQNLQFKLEGLYKFRYLSGDLVGSPEIYYWALGINFSLIYSFNFSK